MRVQLKELVHGLYRVRRATGKHLKSDHREGIDVVRRLIGAVGVRDNFRRHIRRRSHDRVFAFSHRNADFVRESEVDNRKFGGPTKNDVLGFEVTVYIASAMNGAEPLADLIEQP